MKNKVRFNSSDNTDLHCKICGSTKVQILKIRSGLAYYNCANCHYCEKLSIVDDIHTDFLSNQATYYENPSIDPFAKQSLLSKEITQKKLKIAQSHIASGSSILEIGPGDGSFLTGIAQLGYPCTACEQSSLFAKRLRQQGFQVVEGEFEKIPFDFTYDTICSFHIIEHVIAPSVHLSHAYKLTRPGGHMILATPNSASWQQRLFPRLSPNFDEAHLHVFSPQSLTCLAEVAGWKVIRRITPEYTFDWLRVMSKIVRKIKHEDEAATAGKYARASATGFAARVIALVACLTWPLRYIQSSLGGGNEILLVLQKTPAPVAKETPHNPPIPTNRMR